MSWCVLQYRFDVEDEVEEVIAQLSQKDQREKKHEGALNLCIGFHIMKVNWSWESTA